MSYFLKFNPKNPDAGQHLAEVMNRDTAGIDKVVTAKWVNNRAEAQAWFGAFLNENVPQEKTEAGRTYLPPVATEEGPPEKPYNVTDGDPEGEIPPAEDAPAEEGEEGPEEGTEEAPPADADTQPAAATQPRRRRARG